MGESSIKRWAYGLGLAVTPSNRWRGSVNDGWLRAASAEEIVRPRRLIGGFWAAPQLHR